MPPRPLLIAILAAGVSSLAQPQDPRHGVEVFGDQGAGASLSVMQPRGHTQSIDFVVDEGTNVTLDASPRGDWLVFDLLGHLYRVGAKGGAAQVLTQGSGVALNVTPAVSRDGKRIAFASDRSGQPNLWVMNADGSSPVALTKDPEARYMEPAWAPDGRSIAVVRRSAVPGFGVYIPRTEIWSVPVDGSAARLLVRPSNDAGPPVEVFGAPAFSADGRHLYFHRSLASVCHPLKRSHYRIQQLELATGKVVDVRPQAVTATDCETEALQTEAETEPHPSPDGRYLAFALTSARNALSYRGRDFHPGTALMIRDLASGEERRLAMPIASSMTFALEEWLETNPSTLSWSPDGKQVYYMASGHIHSVDISSGKQSTVPFQARVHRALSQQIRPKRPLDTSDSFSPTLLQWTSTSPDGKSLAFIAAGKLWIASRGASYSRQVDTSAIGEDALLYTPSWSPSGEAIAFVAWGPKSGGHVWRYTLRSGALQRLTRVAGRYLYPVWGKDADTLAYLHSATPLRMSPQIYDSPFDDAVWDVVVGRPGESMRKVGETDRPQPLSFGLDGRVRYVKHVPASANARESLSLESIDAVTLAARSELSIAPVPWYWPETQLSPDGKWVSVILSNRVYACEVSKLTGRRFDISTAAAFDICKRLDRSGAWFSHWRDARTVEYSEGSTQISVDVEQDAHSEWPVSVTVQRPKARSALLRNATLITLDGGKIARRGDIKIVDRRIACVGQCNADAATEVIDLTGKFIVPGFIDTHDHTTRMPNDFTYPGEWKSRVSLAYGVTTRYDPFTRNRIIFPLSDLTEAGRIIGPRSFGSGDTIDATVPAGGPIAFFHYEWPLLTAADAEYEVGWRARLGSPIFKYYSAWSRAQGQLLRSAIRANGTVNVTSEGLSIQQEVSWILDGQTQFEHALSGLPVYRDVAQFMGLAGLVYTPTVTAVESINYFRSDPKMYADLDYATYASPEIVQRHIAMSRMPPPVLKEGLVNSEVQAEAAKDIGAYGGRVSVGSHGEIPGIATHLEIQLLSGAMGPAEALRAASLNGAYKLGMEAELGSIEVGKVADLIVLDADPLADIRNTTKIHSVVLSGKVYARSELASPKTLAAGAAVEQRTLAGFRRTSQRR